MAEIVARTKRIFQQPGFAGLLGSAFVLGLSSAFTAPFLSIWGMQDVGMRPTVFGVFMTVTTLSAILVATTLARRSDTHVSRRAMLLLGAAGGVLGYGGYAFVREPWLLLLIGSTLVALSTMCFSQLFAYARERFFAVQIPGVSPAFLMSVVRVCFSLSWTVGPSIGAWLMAHHGFRGVFLGAAGVFLVFLVGVVRFVPSAARPAQTDTVVREPVWRVLTRPDIGLLFVGFVLIFAAHTINMMNLPLVLTKVLGGDERHVGIAFGMGPLAEIPLMLWFGLLAGRGHQLALIRFGAAITVLYFLLLTLVRAPWHVFPIQILHGVSFAIIANVAILFFQDLVPGQPGLATTIFTNAANLGNLTGYFSFGLLVQPLGHRGMFLTSAVCATVTLAIVLLYRPRTVEKAAFPTQRPK